MSHLLRPEFMWIALTDIPQDMQDEFRMHKYAVNAARALIMKLTKGIYGLPQADFMAQQEAHGYIPPGSRVHSVFIYSQQERRHEIHTSGRRFFHQIY